MYIQFNISYFESEKRHLFTKHLQNTKLQIRKRHLFTKYLQNTKLQYDRRNSGAVTPLRRHGQPGPVTTRNHT